MEEDYLTVAESDEFYFFYSFVGLSQSSFELPATEYLKDCSFTIAREMGCNIWGIMEELTRQWSGVDHHEIY